MKQTTTIKPGYKKTSVGIIPEDWEVKRLENICSHFKSGYGITSKDIFDEGKYPVYGGNGLRGYTDTYNHDGKYVLIGRQGALCGNIQEVQGKQYISEHAIAVQTTPDNNLDFLAKKLIYYNLNKLSESSAQPGLAVSKLLRLRLPIPLLPEQKAIADCLSKWDKAIEKQTQLIKAKKEFKKGLMQGLFNGKLTVKDGVLIKAKEGEDFSKSWEERRLGDYFQERKETGFSNKVLLSIGEDGVYPQSESNKKDTSNADKFKYKLIKVDDIGYNTMRLWQGRCALSSLEGIVSPAYTILKPILTKTVPEFFAYYFKMKSVTHKFYRNSQGMVSDTLQCRYKDFKNIKMRIPSYKEQTAIAQILRIADKEIGLLEKRLTQLQLQKKGLMQLLLTGKKRLV